MNDPKAMKQYFWKQDFCGYEFIRDLKDNGR